MKDAAAQTGIPESTIAGWAHQLSIRPGPVLAANENSTNTPREQAASESQDRPAPSVQPRAEIVSAPAHDITLNAEQVRRLKRMNIRDLLLERIMNALHHMEEKHIEIVTTRDDVHQVELPRPTPMGYKMYAGVVATLFKEYRLEAGESTDRTEQTLTHIGDLIKDDHEKDLLKKAIDLAIEEERKAGQNPDRE